MRRSIFIHYISTQNRDNKTQTKDICYVLTQPYIMILFIKKKLYIRTNLIDISFILSNYTNILYTFSISWFSHNISKPKANFN